MSNNHFTGSCLCGAVRFAIAGAFDTLYLCHCSRCRKDTGSAHAANLFSTAARITWHTGPANVRTYRLPGTRHERAFCRTCGSALPSLQMDGTLLVVPAGSLDKSEVVEPDDYLLADIRDAEAIRSVFKRLSPDVVFHAAAHKHVPFLERHPEEAIKTNIYGTLNVLAAAVEADVDRFVNISTDKAADPVSMLGITKRLGERFTSHFAPLTDGVFMSVRFGNVLGSDGSVIPTFREQLRQGKPLTVTHPEATRFFMTLHEAVQLVLEAGAVGGDGNVLVLEMGKPVRILDLAQRVSAELRPGAPVEIEIVGLRRGEKLHEALFSTTDVMVDRPHPQLWRCEVPPLSPTQLNGAGTREALERLVEMPALAADDHQAP